MCGHTGSLQGLYLELPCSCENLGSLRELNLELLGCGHGLGSQGDHSPLRRSKSSAVGESSLVCRTFF